MSNRRLVTAAVTTLLVTILLVTQAVAAVLARREAGRMAVLQSIEAARAEIGDPELMDAILEAAAAHEVPWELLAALSKVGSDHGRVGGVRRAGGEIVRTEVRSPICPAGVSYLASEPNLAPHLLLSRRLSPFVYTPGFTTRGCMVVDLTAEEWVERGPLPPLPEVVLIVVSPPTFPVDGGVTLPGWEAPIVTPTDVDLRAFSLEEEMRRVFQLEEVETRESAARREIVQERDGVRYLGPFAVREGALTLTGEQAQDPKISALRLAAALRANAEAMDTALASVPRTEGSAVQARLGTTGDWKQEAHIWRAAVDMLPIRGVEQVPPVAPPTPSCAALNLHAATPPAFEEALRSASVAVHSTAATPLPAPTLFILSEPGSSEEGVRIVSDFLSAQPDPAQVVVAAVDRFDDENRPASVALKSPVLVQSGARLLGDLGVDVSDPSLAVRTILSRICPLITPPPRPPVFSPAGDMVISLAIGYAEGRGSCLPNSLAGPAVPADVARILSKHGPRQASPQRPLNQVEGLVPRIVEALRAASRAGFAGEDLVTIVAIAGRESTFNPTAFNPNRATGDLSYGLWQINTINEKVWVWIASQLGLSSREQLFIPDVNARAARLLFESSATPFHAWGPYRGDPPLHGGADLWVSAVFTVAVQHGFLDANGLPVLTASGSCSDPGGAWSGTSSLRGPYCDGLRGQTATFNGIPNGQVTREMLTRSRFGGHLQPEAARAWDALAEEARKAGFDIAGWGFAPREGNYSLHTVGLAVDVKALVGGGSRGVDPVTGLPIPELFYSPMYRWMHENAWRFGWCNPRSMRPTAPPFLGTGRGARLASGTGLVLEPWHWEFVAGSTSYQPPIRGDANGPHGVPD